jgi:lipopolysaccharide/colanic/teichoic acid biosynthesis glycosyltransferase
LIVISLPVLVAAAAAIRVTSRGPIFYLQERCGHKGRLFRVIKFRSMVSDADELVPEMTQLAAVTGLKTTDAPMFKSEDDPRVTKVGRLLRRTGIDELPQLVNVVAGHMSLVGPRPLVSEEAATLAPLAAERRHSVRPGLTCFWQVLREEETTFAERMQLDLLYVNHRSLVLDLSLIALTPIAIAGGNGSY